ncbi:hypothetical protein GCM10011519_21050 [Marmoricola endophyticus]|uniref:YdhG-like domain-containing protein n=1 Tax=Marmoricola endophyticus TaxID=2040280 RepID=A0A917BIF5_9ACTN|nr:DUF1801 domain-containing protein [Marmoricola endophyticus]GGF46837.1 hypothetical protein GCM10011519_21050 [Marmoricola endophyticus]
MSSTPEVEAYVAALPDATRPRFEQLLALVRECTGDGFTEALRYGVPTLRREGRNVLHVGGFAAHVAVYPLPDTTADPGLAAAMAPYVAGKGTLRFPHAQPLPEAVVRRVVGALVGR